MVRSLLALAALLSMSLSLAHADYIIIKVNMAVPPPEIVVPKKPGQDPNVGMPFQPFKPPVDPAQKKLETKPTANPNMTVVGFLESSREEWNKRFIGLPPKTHVYNFEHRFGRSLVIYDDKYVTLAPAPKEGQPKMIIRKTVKTVYEDKRKEIIGKQKVPARYLELADYCLTHGLVEKCADVMEDLAKLENDDPKVAKAVKAFNEVRAELARPVSKDDDAITWRDELKYKIDRSAHYCVLYDNATVAEVQGRKVRLERNMAAFYYWFALKGVSLKVPQRRLVAVLIDKEIDLLSVHKVCEAPWLVADGFYGRRDNLAVMSATRLDPASKPFYNYCVELVQAGWDLKNILDPKFRIPPALLRIPQELAHVQTMALVKKLLDEESELAAVSHQGSRQLLTAVGMLPRSVEIPEWIQFGWASFFETPKFDMNTHTGAFWPGTGAPSWVYLVQFKVWEGDKMLDDPVQALLGVLTDQYFRDAQITRNLFALQKGRTYAWALTYYLSQRQLQGLIRYGEELALLPRDLEFDGHTHLGCFARAFDKEFKLVDATQPNGINRANLETMARDWFKFISQEPLQMPDILQEAQKHVREIQKAFMGGAP